MTTEIVFETHSISTDNEAGIATGWLDGRLSEAGRQYARELGARRRSERVDAVHTSDLRRAVETAEIAFAGSDIEIRHDWRLRECNYGKLNGVPVELLERDRPHHVDDHGRRERAIDRSSSGFRISCATSPTRRARGGSWSSDTPRLDGRSTTLLHGVPLETLMSSPFDRQEGWVYSFNRPELRASS